MAQKKKATRGPDSFTTYVLDQLSALGRVEARRVFSRYFRVSDETRPGYVARGSVPFEPMPGHVMAVYHEVPGTVLEDADATVEWARKPARTAKR